MKLKIKAVANDIDSIEKLINEYFYSSLYYIELNSEDRSGRMNFVIKSRKRMIPDFINESYKVKLRKGRYYFYKVIEDGSKDKG